MIQRITVDGISYEEITVEADLLLYYISLIKYKDAYRTWFPTMYIYLKEYKRLDIFRKLDIKRYFENIKYLFDIKLNDLQLKGLIQAYIAVMFILIKELK